MTQDMVKSDAEITHTSSSRGRNEGLLEHARELVQNDLSEKARQFESQRKGWENESHGSTFPNNGKDPQVHRKDDEQNCS
ncbi:hypothetical protein BEL01nite_73000 [Bradyrhizobium elkanii]|nr:hypothetical protein BEL01nite_73000 [Bradyrhizobium elkanii]